MKHRLVLLALVGLPLLTNAQAIWRCGPDGRSFSDTPCPEGRALPVADTRPSEDVAEARARADRDIRLADKLRRERLREEAAQRGSGLAALGPVAADARVTPRRQELRQAPRAKPAVRRPGPEADGTFRAVAPASRRAKG